MFLNRIFILWLILILFVIILFLIFIIVNLEVSELICISSTCNNTKPITQIIFLQVLLSKVLKISLGKGDRRGQDDLVFLAPKGYFFTKVTGLALDFDGTLKVFLKITTVHDTIFYRMRAIDVEFKCGLLSFSMNKGILTLKLLFA